MKLILSDVEGEEKQKLEVLVGVLDEFEDLNLRRSSLMPELIQLHGK